MIEEPCKSCKGQCCNVGFVVPVFQYELIYNNLEIVNQNEWPLEDGPFKTMKSNGDGYTCICLKNDGTCGIWEQRPQTCKDFEVNGNRCLSIRKIYGKP
jgi:Fe-S-cluster containining protein